MLLPGTSSNNLGSSSIGGTLNVGNFFGNHQCQGRETGGLVGTVEGPGFNGTYGIGTPGGSGIG